MANPTMQAFIDRCHRILQAAGFKKRFGKMTASGWRVYRKGYSIHHFAGHWPTLHWEFTTEYLNSQHRDLGPEYRTYEGQMETALRNAGVYVFRDGTRLVLRPDGVMTGNDLQKLRRTAGERG